MKSRFFAAVLFSISTLLSVAHAAAINLNTASAEEIAAALSGIGAAKAGAIVAFREEHGNFLSIEDLVLVKGIGESLLERNRENLIVE